METLLCGPAASTIGCVHLTDRPNSIVVDMGGTTTDIALIRNGVPVTVTDGVSIGKWKTFVDGLYIKTFGLGGDTAVHYREQKLYLEEYRVIPLCVAAAKHPSITEHLRQLEMRRHTKFLYEHFLLMKDISNSPRYTAFEKAFCAALKEQPLPLTQAAEAVGKEIYTLHVERLLKDGVIQLCGLTPTDIMHLRGDFTQYDAEASRLGAEFAAFNLGVTVEELCDLVYDQVRRRLYVNIVKVLLEHKFPGKTGVSSDVELFILANYEEMKKGAPDPLLSTMFRTDFSLIGVGAPICVFLEDVAAMLGTHAIFPENHQVANALGAIVGSVSATCTIEIQPDNSVEGTSGYQVFGSQVHAVFKDLDSAVAFAAAQAEASAKAQAQQRGARGHITVTTQVHAEEAEIRDGTVYLGTVVTAHAAGSMGF